MSVATAAVTQSSSQPAAESAKKPVLTAARRRTGFRFTRSRGIGWLLVVALVLGWQVLGTFAPNPSLSTPLAVVQAWWRFAVEDGSLTLAVLDTLRTLLIGYPLAVVIGIVLGFTMGRVKAAWAALEPTVELIRLTPASALIPLFILFLGVGDEMKIAVLLSSVTFPVLLNAYAGARNVTTTLKQTADTFQLNWLQTQWEVALPAAIPFIMIGMRQALGSALILTMVVGMLSGTGGLGYFILTAQYTMNARMLLAGVLTIALLGYVLNALFLITERLLTPWRRRETE